MLDSLIALVPLSTAEWGAIGIDGKFRRVRTSPWSVGGREPLFSSSVFHASWDAAQHRVAGVVDPNIVESVDPDDVRSRRRVALPSGRAGVGIAVIGRRVVVPSDDDTGRVFLLDRESLDLIETWQEAVPGRVLVAASPGGGVLATAALRPGKDGTWDCSIRVHEYVAKTLCEVASARMVLDDRDRIDCMVVLDDPKRVVLAGRSLVLFDFGADGDPDSR